MSIQKLLELTNGGLARPDIRAGTRLTEELWRAAHGAHLSQYRLHQAGAHGYGIIHGLQVTATQPGSRFVTIHPGMALDPFGRLVAVTENDRDRALRLFNVDVGRAGWVYIVLEYRDDLTEAPLDSTNNYMRVLEYAHCEATLLPPFPHQIELARVLLSQDDRPVTDPADPLRPGINEIDLRFRAVVGSGVRREVVIGQIFHAKPKERTQWDLHRPGLALLIRHLQNTGRMQATYQPLVQLTGDEQSCTMLYLTGTGSLALNPEQVERLKAYLQSGGVIYAESCQSGFDKAVKDVVGQLGVKLQTLPARHPLLSAQHVFAGAPEGGPADAGQIHLGVGPGGRGTFILSSRDFGCAWEGVEGLTRARIRDAMEFGENLTVFAAEQRERAALEQLAPPVHGAG